MLSCSGSSRPLSHQILPVQSFSLNPLTAPGSSGEEEFKEFVLRQTSTPIRFEAFAVFEEKMIRLVFAGEKLQEEAAQLCEMISNFPRKIQGFSFEALLAFHERIYKLVGSPTHVRVFLVLTEWAAAYTALHHPRHFLFFLSWCLDDCYLFDVCLTALTHCQVLTIDEADAFLNKLASYHQGRRRRFTQYFLEFCAQFPLVTSTQFVSFKVLPESIQNLEFFFKSVQLVDSLKSDSFSIAVFIERLQEFFKTELECKLLANQLDTILCLKGLRFCELLQRQVVFNWISVFLERKAAREGLFPELENQRIVGLIISNQLRGLFDLFMQRHHFTEMNVEQRFFLLKLAEAQDSPDFLVPLMAAFDEEAMKCFDPGCISPRLRVYLAVLEALKLIETEAEDLNITLPESLQTLQLIKQDLLAVAVLINLKLWGIHIRRPDLYELPIESLSDVVTLCNDFSKDKRLAIVFE